MHGKQTAASVVFHTISPVHGVPDSVQYRVNVEGTKTLLRACRHESLSGSVKKLVYTSSTGVVWKAYDLHGVSEAQAIVPAEGYDSYHHTKAIAESLILNANGQGIHTVVLRPCGMIGYVLYCVSFSKACDDIKGIQDQEIGNSCTV